MIQWRKEGEPVKPGLSFWRPGDRSIGFILSLDRLYIWCRYSKVKRKMFWNCERREPRAWRMLKAKDDDNN